ncbi:hypothetical protein [Bradyrhizobium elkanii]|uniref:hypothetical protein n=1 Tax=Bradyrhizobium elkanii TaxID=29448 RepID=UPI002729C4CC|nr:hypothetical protein [Bradyrhizobium elkanii]WLA79820.1 hypothetical protein QNJ99_31110 [Bradyrhizobium elkanii]
MADCRSLPQMCLLGPIPPRTPGRSDAQVPSDAARGASKYGRIPFVYFYQTGAAADPAFGLLDIEVAVQRRGPGSFACEVYAIGDGYQAGHGASTHEPMVFEFRGRGRTIARAEWLYPTILSGHMDALTFSIPLELTEDEFALLDSVLLPPARAEVTVCLE